MATGTIEALDLAVTAGLLEDGDVPGHFSFAHALVRQSLRERLTATRRARLHGAVGEAIERKRPDDRRLGELAHHFAAAAIGSDVGRAVEYAERAGRYSSSELNYEDAALQFATALALLERADAPAPEQRCDLLLALGDAENRSGSPRARDTHRAAAALARELGDAERLARATLGFGGEGLAGVWWHEVGAVDAELIELLRAALAELDDADGALRVRLLARLATETLWTESFDDLEQLSQAALDMARRLDEPATLAFALSARCLAISDPERLPLRGELAEELVGVAGELRDRELEMMALGLQMSCALARADRGPFDRGVDARARITEEVPYPLFRWYTSASRGLSAQLDGRFEDAERLFTEGLATGSQVQGNNARQAYSGQMVTLRYDQGRLSEIEEPVRDYVERYPLFAAWRCALALVLAETGQDAEARAALDRAADGGGFAALPRGTGWLLGLDFAAKTAVAVGGHVARRGTAQPAAATRRPARADRDGHLVRRRGRPAARRPRARARPARRGPATRRARDDARRVHPFTADARLRPACACRGAARRGSGGRGANACRGGAGDRQAAGHGTARAARRERAGAGRAVGPETSEAPAGAGASKEAAEGTRTLDLLHGKQTL